MVPAPEAIRQALQERLLARLDHPDPLYRDLLQDYPRRGGKMLRGLLTVYSALAHGAPLEAGLEAATALELFQNWILVHDAARPCIAVEAEADATALIILALGVEQDEP